MTIITRTPSPLRCCLTLITAFLLISPLVQAQVQVQQVYSRPLPPGQSVAAVYLTISNQGEQPVVLVAGSSPVAKRLEFHRHIHADGMMQMRQLDSVKIEPGKTLRFAPGDYHIMLFGVSRAFKVGDTIPLILLTNKQQEIKVVAEVKAYR